MEESENLYDKIRELFGNIPDNLNILEQTIDIDTQLEYFELSREIKDQLNQDEVMLEAELLFDKALPVGQTRFLLSKIASVEKIEAFRLIEKYMLNPHPELKEWGTLALQESKMLIESKLLDESQVFISTGLGGKGSKLRYFAVFLANNDLPLNNIQRKVIKNEFGHILQKHDAEIEEISFSDYIATILAVIPIQVTVKQMFNEAIAECNQYGNFLIDNFIITNVKILEFQEIKEFIEKNKVRK